MIEDTNHWYGGAHSFFCDGRNRACDLGHKMNGLMLVKDVMFELDQIANFNAVVLNHAYIIACENARVNLLFQNKVLDWKSLESLTNLLVAPTNLGSNSCRRSTEQGAESVLHQLRVRYQEPCQLILSNNVVLYLRLSFYFPFCSVYISFSWHQWGLSLSTN